VKERVSGGLRRRQHQPPKLSDGGGGSNSGEKFAQPGGAKFMDFREQKRRRSWSIYRGTFRGKGNTKSNGIGRFIRLRFGTESVLETKAVVWRLEMIAGS
jgi:hypothetical protein